MDAKKKKEEQFYEIWVDGKKIGILPEKMAKKEQKRLHGLHGVKVIPVFGLVGAKNE